MLVGSPEWEVSRHVRADERLLWSGRPRRGIYLTRYDYFFIPFSVVWSGFVAFMLVAVLNSHDPGPGLIVLPLFLVVGLYMTIGRFVVEWILLRKTLYAITSQRALIIRGDSVRSINLRALDEISYKRRKDGSGSITFGPDLSFTPAYARSMAYGVVPRFQGIGDVHAVYDLIGKVQAE
jgi:hypothetical protein